MRTSIIRAYLVAPIKCLCTIDQHCQRVMVRNDDNSRVVLLIFSFFHYLIFRQKAESNFIGFSAIGENQKEVFRSPRDAFCAKCQLLSFSLRESQYRCRRHHTLKFETFFCSCLTIRLRCTVRDHPFGKSHWPETDNRKFTDETSRKSIS